MKFCKRCKSNKSKDLFTKDSRAIDGLSTYCKVCHNEKNRQLYKKQGDFAKLKFSLCKQEYRQTPKGKYVTYIHDVKHKFNKTMSAIEFDTFLQHLLLKQRGCCAVCGIDFSELSIQYCVDHDHNTGKIRDLLCSKCNIKRG